MPIYEYTCPACGAAEEKLEPLSAPASHDCPQCGAAQGMARQLSVAAVATSTPSAGGGRASTPCGNGGCGCPFAS